ncbi:MAG: hypothetical protein IPM53_29215 [Anaerolineaceae bacterium]|nr:hypothetical protein [Anaerolineaceae bacterium]
MMAETKLILVEGLPGSGKTTTAEFIASWLERRGVATAVFLEGNLDHPADFESVACLDAQEYTDLNAQFPAEAGFLASQVVCEGDDYFFRYRYLQQTYPQLSPALLAALARYEIYELPAEKYRRLVRRRWQRFASLAAAGDVTYIFECCFLQNPLTMFLGRHDEPVSAAQAFILELAAAVQALQPRWFYLHPGDVRTTLTQAAQSRPQEWLDFVIAYHTQQGHGKAQGWQGFEGLVRFYEMRQAIELALLPQLPFPGLLVNHTDWATDQARITSFMTRTFSL